MLLQGPALWVVAVAVWLAARPNVHGFWALLWNVACVLIFARGIVGACNLDAHHLLPALVPKQFLNKDSADKAARTSPSYDDSWRQAMSPELSSAWESFSNLIVQEFVYDAWWSSLSPDTHFPALVRQLLNNAAGILVARAERVSLENATVHLLHSLANAVHVYRSVRHDLVQHHGRKEFESMVASGMLTSLVKAELMSQGFLPTIFEANDNLYRFLKDVCERIVPVLTASQPSHPLAHAFASQLILCCVLRPVLQLTMPEHLNPLCLTLITMVLRDHPVLVKSASKAPGTTQPTSAQVRGGPDSSGVLHEWQLRAARTAARETSLAPVDTPRRAAARAGRPAAVPLQEVLSVPSPFVSAASTMDSVSLGHGGVVGTRRQGSHPGSRGPNAAQTAAANGLDSAAPRPPSALSRVSSSVTHCDGPFAAVAHDPDDVAASGSKGLLSEAHLQRTFSDQDSSRRSAGPRGINGAGHAREAGAVPDASALQSSEAAAPALRIKTGRSAAVPDPLRAANAAVGRSARVAGSAIRDMYKSVAGEKPVPCTDPVTPPRAPTTSSPARTPGSRGMGGSSRARSGTLSVDHSEDESDVGSESGGDSGAFWDLDGAAAAAAAADADAAQAHRRVRGEVTGEVVYLSAEHFDSVFVGVAPGEPEGDSTLASQGKRARLRKSLRLRRSVVPAWNVQVQQSALEQDGQWRVQRTWSVQRRLADFLYLQRILKRQCRLPHPISRKVGLDEQTESLSTFFKDLTEKEWASQSRPVLLFLQASLLNFRAAAREAPRREPSRSLSPAKPQQLLHSIKHKMGLQRSPALPRAPGGAAEGGTDSAVSSRVSSPGPRAGGSPHVPGTPSASNPQLPSAAAARGVPLTHSASASALARPPPSEPGDDLPPAGAAQQGQASKNGEADEPADVAFFQVLTQLGKALYPSRRSWMGTAQRVATWLGLPRTARLAVQALLRQHAASHTAATSHLRLLQSTLWPDGRFFAANSGPAPQGPPVQKLPSDFLARDGGGPKASSDRDALHALLTEIVPHVLREAVASNSRLKTIQMPEVISLRDHTDACMLVFEMLQSPEIVQALLLAALQHTLGEMFAEEGVGALFEEGLWKMFRRRVHR